MRKPTLAQLLILAAAFLAVVMGGQVGLEAGVLSPDLAAQIRDIFNGSQAPTLSHAVVSLLTAAAAIVVLVRRRVLQVPTSRLLIPTLAFFGILTGSLAVTEFRSVTVVSLAEWLTYGLAFFVVVSAIGRRGAGALVAMVVAGCFLLAWLGIWEYAISSDPSWRVFSLWTPNSLAGILLIGLVLALGMVVVSKRIAALVIGVACAPIGATLYLTQSRGGLLAAAVGVLALALLALLWSGSARAALFNLGKLALCGVGIAAFLALTLTSAQSGPPGIRSEAPSGFVLVQEPVPAQQPPAAFSRLRGSGAAEVQSAGFRRNLWRGAISLVREHPVGTGLGTYVYHSPSTGLTTQTQLAHQSFLQLGVEATVLAPLFLLLVGGIWLFEVFRGARALPPGQNLLRGAIVAAIVGSTAHNLIDSDLYTFGIGWVFFALLGAGLLLSADAVAPEYTPKSARAVGVVAAVLLSIAMLHGGLAEAMRARARYERDVEQDMLAAQDLAKRAVAFAPADGEGYRLLATVVPSLFERGQALERAAELHPNVRNLRQLATFTAEQGDMAKATSIFNQALERDPNNLTTLSQLMAAQMQYGDQGAALDTAGRIVAVEQTPYFQVRSIPEVVPVDTYLARAFLAQAESDLAKRAEMLDETVAGFESYLASTFPLLKQMAQAAGSPDAQYAGDSFSAAREKMRQAAIIADTLAATYRELGLPEQARTAEAKRDRFLAAAREELRLPSPPPSA